MKGLSDSNMNKLWRKAVLKKNMNRCFLCGRTIDNFENPADLECHHIRKRRHSILKYDFT